MSFIPGNRLRSLIAAAFVVGAYAATCVEASAVAIRRGAVVQVKPNSIWFEDAAKFLHWQRLKKSGNAAALASYQDDLLHRRDAWQFTNPLTVRVVRYLPHENRVEVEMVTDGRFVDTPWILDADALSR
jgi:hypothetical protein